jgi:hypothetical protein
VDPWSNENKGIPNGFRKTLRFPKVSQHPACKDDGILHGKPFGNYFIN